MVVERYLNILKRKKWQKNHYTIRGGHLLVGPVDPLVVYKGARHHSLGSTGLERECMTKYLCKGMFAVNITELNDLKQPIRICFFFCY